MEVLKFYCQNCVEVTLYSGLKPRFCAFCGKSFSLFSSGAVPLKSQVVESEKDNDPFFEPIPSIRPASYYRNKTKAKIEEDEDLEEREDDDEIDDGEMDEFGADSGENLQSLFGQGLAKRNKGVKFGDIVKVDAQPNESKQVKARRKRGKIKKPS